MHFLQPFTMPPDRDTPGDDLLQDPPPLPFVPPSAGRVRTVKITKQPKTSNFEIVIIYYGIELQPVESIHALTKSVSMNQLKYFKNSSFAGPKKQTMEWCLFWSDGDGRWCPVFTANIPK